MRLFLFFAFLPFFQSALASESPACDASPKTFFGSNSHGDIGCFQPGQENFLILRAGNKASVVSRWRSSFGNKYRIWDNVKDSAVSLGSRSSFDSALVHFGNRAPAKDWCEIVEDPWSEWVPATNPTACGLHTVVQNRTCSSVGLAAKPCPDTCLSATESRSYEVDNGACNTAPSIYLTGTDIGGQDGSAFSPGFSFYDAEGDALEALWTGATACIGLYQTGIWLSVSNSIGARFSRTIQPGYMGNNCQINVRVRDQNGLEGTPKMASGLVTNSCFPPVFIAPDGSTPAEYALTCSPPAEFIITDQCGEQEVDLCVGDSPVWSDWMQNYSSYYYHITRTGLGGQGGVKHEIRWAASTIASWTEPAGSPTTPIDKVVSGFTYQGGSIFEGPYTYDWQKRAIRRIETN
jgi:hypothetical protein